MAFGNFTLTGQFFGLDGVTPAVGRVQIDGLPQVIVDSAGSKFRVGPRTVVLDAQGKFSISLPSNSATGNSTTIAYRVTPNLKHQNLAPVEFYARPIGATVDLSDPNISPPGGVVPLTPTGVSQADFNAFVASVGTLTSSTTATLEELQHTTAIPTISTPATVILGAPNFDERVGALTLAFTAAVAASDTSYWSISLVRIRNNGTPVALATVTTKATGGLGISAYTGWSFDNVSWPSVLRYVLKGDILALVFTPTGTPPNLVGGVATLRYEPNVVPVLRDTFNRNDSTTSVGSADTGQAWTSALGTWGIKTQALSVQVKNGTAGARDYATVDSGLASGSITATLLDVANSGVAIRLARAAGGSFNGYIHNATTLFRADNDVLTAIGTFTQTFVNGDEITIAYAGSSFTVYRNGFSAGTFTDATYTTGTLVGVRSSSGAVVNVPQVDTLAVAV